ncbi:MAG: PDZ domain-containing protein [Gemmatimonadetes bacterium]|nr:PDZ domain-containing protein [Gemmatimonadota bacterium]
MRILTALLVLVLAASPLVAQQTVDPKKPAPAPAMPTTGYGAWFGSIPDMDNSTTGIFLNGVTAGSPAEKAGLKAGDTLLKMAGKPTIDLQSMTEVLRAHKPGDTITVVFQREGAEKSVAVILGVRPGS